mgnify:CR=1 FL=1
MALKKLNGLYAWENLRQSLIKLHIFKMTCYGEGDIMSFFGHPAIFFDAFDAELAFESPN